MRKYHVRFGGGLSQKYHPAWWKLGGSLPYPSANYEELLSELAKNGAAMALATQSLARLDALDPDRSRALRATVFANLDGLFAFHVSAEDAVYLAAELGGGLDPQDLLELGDYHCYARLWSDARGGERLPAFLVKLDPPPPSDGALARELARASAERYGRPIDAVEADRQTALERPTLLRAAALVQSDGLARIGQSPHAAPGLLVAPGVGIGTPTAEADRGASGPDGTSARASRRRPSKEARRRAAAAAGQAARPAVEGEGLADTSSESAARTTEEHVVDINGHETELSETGEHEERSA